MKQEYIKKIGMDIKEFESVSGSNLILSKNSIVETNGEVNVQIEGDITVIYLIEKAAKIIESSHSNINKIVIVNNCEANLIHDKSGGNSNCQIFLLNGANLEVFESVKLFNTNVKNEINISHHENTKFVSKTNVVLNESNYDFRGNIEISNDAKHVESVLYNNNLILDNKSSVQTIPSLEILNKEVKATHAATISGINKDQINYLQMRGINEIEARKLLIEAFLQW